MAATPFIYFLVLLCVSTAVSAAAATQTGSVCRSTLDPAFCKTALPNQTGNVYAYGRSSVRKSLSSSQKFLRTVEKQLRGRAWLTVGAVRALEDCQLLAGLNIDYLAAAMTTVDRTSSALPEMKAEEVASLLSALLTNQQTCMDGLKATAGSWSLKNGLSLPLATDTKLYSMSLALFTKGWVPKKKKRSTWKGAGKQGGFGNGRMSVKMSSRAKAIYEAAARRNLQQSNDEDGGDDQISVRDIVVVSQDGSGNFTTINEAIAAAPNNSAPTEGYFLIFVSAGVYEEYVSIAKNKRYLMMIGDGINQTVITGNRSVVDGWTTFNSATFAVVGPGFVAVNMTFRNTAGAEKHQAVAVRSGADLSTFYLCSFEAYQDTLYTHSLRQFYRDCDIYGTVDFIFGNAAVVFQNCNIHPRLPMANQFNAITAQGRTDPNQNTGTSIQNCRITPADDLANATAVKTFLGRPWKEFSRTVYLQNFMDGFINPAGWRAWDGEFALNTSYYAEFGNFGPGSNTSERVNWTGFHLINDTDAGNFTAASFVLADDWLPQTGVPYTSGLTE